MLVGRAPELAAIDELLGNARSGASGALVLRGEPGIGKSVLLAHAGEQAADMRLLRVRAFESEQGLPFAGLSSLLSPVAHQLDEVPAGQRRALATALGSGGAWGDRSLRGLRRDAAACSRWSRGSAPWPCSWTTRTGLTLRRARR